MESDDLSRAAPIGSVNLGRNNVPLRVFVQGLVHTARVRYIRVASLHSHVGLTLRGCVARCVPAPVEPVSHCIGATRVAFLLEFLNFASRNTGYMVRFVPEQGNRGCLHFLRDTACTDARRIQCGTGLTFSNCPSQ